MRAINRIPNCLLFKHSSKFAGSTLSSAHMRHQHQALLWDAVNIWCSAARSDGSVTVCEPRRHHMDRGGASSQGGHEYRGCMRGKREDASCRISSASSNTPLLRSGKVDKHARRIKYGRKKLPDIWKDKALCCVVGNVKSLGRRRSARRERGC